MFHQHNIICHVLWYHSFSHTANKHIHTKWPSDLQKLGSRTRKLSLEIKWLMLKDPDMRHKLYYMWDPLTLDYPVFPKYRISHDVINFMVFQNTSHKKYKRCPGFLKWM